MNFSSVIKELKDVQLISRYDAQSIRNLIFYSYLEKKREILRNSHQSDTFLKRFFKNSLDFESIRKIFYNKHLFSYSDDKLKPELLEILKLKCQSEADDYVKLADEILIKKISIFEKRHEFGEKFNWQYGFCDDFVWKKEKSEQINIRPINVEVDVKYVWELNRHQFLTYLGFAFYITKNEKYAKAFKSIVLDWIKNNAPLYGVNWYSGLEISLRLVSWIFSLYFFKDSTLINNTEFFKKIFSSMFQHAYFLKYFHARRSFNHTIGEIFGIYLFSKVFNDIRPIKRWERKFFNKFKNQITRQTRSDGTNIEQSINYHRFVLEFFSLFLTLNSDTLTHAEYSTVNRMYDYLLFSIKPNNNLPLIGDFDDGKVLPLTLYDRKSHFSLLNLGAILFNRGDLKYISKEITPIPILLLGLNGYEMFKKITIQEPRKKIEYFKNAGHVFLRNCWTSDANYLFFDYGEFGSGSAGHSHSSITNFIFTYDGNDIVVDSGTFSYNKSWDIRNHFRSSKAHNVLTIDQKNQARVNSWFGWKDIPRIKRKFLKEDDRIIFDCFHSGYENFIIHRKITTDKNIDKLTIKDTVYKKREILDKGYNDINIYYHFDKAIDISLEDNVVKINNNLILKVSSNYKYSINLEKEEYSPYYGFKVEKDLLNIHLKFYYDNKDKIILTTEIKTII